MVSNINLSEFKQLTEGSNNQLLLLLLKKYFYNKYMYKF